MTNRVELSVKIVLNSCNKNNELYPCIKNITESC